MNCAKVNYHPSIQNFQQYVASHSFQILAFTSLYEAVEIPQLIAALTLFTFSHQYQPCSQVLPGHGSDGGSSLRF